MSRSQRVFAIAWLVLAAVSLWGSGRPELAGFDAFGLPSDLPNWTHVETVTSGPPHHEISINTSNIQAAKRGDIYQDGTKFVLVLYNDETKPFQYQVMMKDRQLFVKTGGWGFASFTPDGKREQVDGERDCWSCHSNPKTTDHVFSSSIQ